MKLAPDQKDAVYYQAIARLGEGRVEEAQRFLDGVDERSDFHQAARALLATLPKPPLSICIRARRRRAHGNR